MKSYSEKEDGISDKEWLAKQYKEELPDITEEKAMSLAEETVSTIEEYDKNLASLNEDCSKWLLVVAIGVGIVPTIFGIVYTWKVKWFINSCNSYLFTLDYLSKAQIEDNDNKNHIFTRCVLSLLKLIFFELMNLWFGIIIVLIALLKIKLKIK